jgi:hypothetical protein
MARHSEGFVELREGSTIPVAAYRLALRLEAEGLRLTAATGADGPLLHVGLIGGGKATLDPDTVAEIRQWKHHLLQIVAYVAPSVASVALCVSR